MRKFYIRLGIILGPIAAIATIVGTLYAAGILNFPPPPTPTATLAPPTATPVPTATPFVVSAGKFVGQWDGLELSNIIHQAPTLIRFVISQQGDVLSQQEIILMVQIYSEIGDGLPSQPQWRATGTVSGGQITLYTTGAPVDQWVLSLPDPTTLHFTHHTHFPSGAPPTPTRAETSTILRDRTRSCSCCQCIATLALCAIVGK